MASLTIKLDLRDFFEGAFIAVAVVILSVYILFSRLLLSKEANQDEYTSCCKEANFLKASTGLSCTREVRNICWVSSAFKNCLCRQWTLQNITCRCVFMIAAMKSHKHKKIVMGLGQINWNHFAEKLLALKNTG